MAITRKLFGTMPDGREVDAYTLTNSKGASITVLTYGAILQSIIVPDSEGKMADVALGFDNLDKYLAPHGSMGDTVGRYANRIGKGQFTLDGVQYQLALNDHGINHLHGGFEGFSKKVWAAETASENGSDSVALTYVSPDGEENFPGTLHVRVTYSWNDSCDLSIHYEAETDKATICNLTNHSYFNLAGHDHGTVDDHDVMIDADAVTAVDAGLIPTGGYTPVVGTPLDLRDGMLLGDGFAEMDSCPVMKAVNGYDINYVLRKGSAMGTAASVFHEESGRYMEVLTDLPGIQLYTACSTDLEGGKNGAHYGIHSGLCLETQVFPDSPNKPQWQSPVLRPGQKYDTTTIYAFRA